MTNTHTPRKVSAAKVAALIATPILGIAKGVDENNTPLVIIGALILLALAAIVLTIGVRDARRANTTEIIVRTPAEADSLEARLRAVAGPGAHIYVNRTQ